MYKVLLIDDEEIIREHLKRAISWKELNCEIIGEARNTAVAIALTNKYSPDIAIVDINLLGESGLVYMEKIHKKYPNIKFIVLSGYSEFEYARSAITNGAVDYLLKPLNGKSLRETMEKTIDAIRREREIETDIKRAKFREKSIKSQREVLSYLEGYSEEGYKNISIEGDSLYAVIMDSADVDINYEFIDELERMTNKIGGIVLEGLCFNWIIIFNTTLSAHDISQYFDQVKKNLAEKLEHKIHVGIGKSVSSKKDLIISYQQAKEALKESILFDLSASKTYSKSRTISKEINVDKLTNSIFDCIKDQNSDLLYIILSNTIKQSKTLQDLQLMNSFLQTILHQALIKYKGVSIEEFKLDNFKSVEDCHEQWYKAFNHCLTCEANEEFVFSDKSEFVIKAKELIEEEFGDRNLGLTTIADSVHVSPSYLSTIFKKEMAVSIKEYITKIRMQNAYSKLLLGQERIYGIAEACGYNDVYYFSKCFKKYYGSNPSEQKFLLNDHK